MAVELMLGNRTTAFNSKTEENDVKEAASGLDSVDKLINLISKPLETSSSLADKSDMATDSREVADAAVSKFWRVSSLLGRNRIGHARFRRGPVAPSQVPENPIQEKKIYYANPIPPPRSERRDTVSFTTTINFSDYGSGDQQRGCFLTGGESERKVMPLSCIFHISDLSRTQLSASASFKRKCRSDNQLGPVSCHSVSPKKRRLKLKKVVRVPALSLKTSPDVPPDEYSWRKYGQKLIKGSPHPRGYYKCSSVRGCPARKHMERAVDDPAMLVVTYEGDHNHSVAVADTANLKTCPHFDKII